MLLEVNSLEEAAKQLTYFRNYAPYKCGGKWFVACIGGEYLAFRTKDSVKRHATKAGLCTVAIATITN